jgi:hypothetical protein
LTVLGTTACVRQPMAVLRPTATTAKPATSLVKPAPSTAAPAATPAAPSAPNSRVVRLSGVVQVPTALDARTANVKNGFAIGTPIRVIEVATGRVLKQDVTYYDGSFQLDLSAPTTAQPVVLAIDLVDAADEQVTCTLETPLVLDKGISTVDNVAVTIGSTALVMMYRRWAEAEQGTAQPSSYALARFILSTSADTTKSFGLLVAQDAQIPVAADVASLKKALEGYVARAQAKQEKTR